jgi:flagellar protein FlaJ
MVTAGLPAAFLVLGFAILPTGVMAWLDDRNVDKLDQETSTFIRAIGNVSASLGSTIGTALSKMDRRSMGNLEPYLQRLQVRMRTNIKSELCWDAFRDEVGAELMNRSTRIFVDGVALGGPADKVGNIAAEYALDAALMRARRNANASPFAMLTIPLHFAMTGLMLFILEIMKTFNTIITTAIEEMETRSSGAALSALPAIPVFQPQNMDMITYLTVAAVIAYTVANALAPKVAKGGHPFLCCTFGAITCLMTGFNMLIIPPVASSILLNAGA